ncbi:MAG: A24 family peptidase [Paraperlucidibaca sp.]
MLLLVVIFGLIIGSFCNVVIHRTPKQMDAEYRADVAAYLEAHDLPNPLAETITGQDAGTKATRFDLSHPRSHCPHCHTTLRWRDLWPVISWLLLKGRCHHCHARIGLRYPLVELAVAAIALACVLSLGWQLSAVAAAVFSTLLLVAALIDFDSQWLPDRLTLLLLWLGLLATALGINPMAISLHESVTASALSYGVFWGLAAGFKLFTGRDGLGGGDTKLLAALGAWLGPWVLPNLLLMASLIGLVFALWWRWRKGEHGAFAFGPALAIAGALLFWQPLVATLANSFATQSQTLWPLGF